MRFTLSVNPFTATAMNVAAAHGFVDLGMPKLLPVYGLALLPQPGSVTTVLFFASSLIHFARDLTGLGSACVHFLFALLYFRADPSIAFSVAVVFNAYIHAPIIYARQASRRRFGALTAALVATCACFVRPIFLPGELVFGYYLQRFVICHVLICEMERALQKKEEGHATASH